MPRRSRYRRLLSNSQKTHDLNQSNNQSKTANFPPKHTSTARFFSFFPNYFGCQKISLFWRMHAYFFLMRTDNRANCFFWTPRELTPCLVVMRFHLWEKSDTICITGPKISSYFMGQHTYGNYKYLEKIWSLENEVNIAWNCIIKSYLTYLPVYAWPAEKIIYLDLISIYHWKFRKKSILNVFYNFGEVVKSYFRDDFHKRLFNPEP